MLNKRPAPDIEELKKRLLSMTKPGLSGPSERSHSRFQHWPTARLSQSLAVRKQRLQELKKADPTFRIWGIGDPGPIEVEAARLQREIEEMEVECIRRGKNRPPVSAEPDSTPAEAGAATLQHSEDFRTIHFKGQRHELTGGQAQIVGFLYTERQNGIPEVHQDRLLEALGSPSSRLRDTFRKSPLWGTLIVQGKRRGTYRLEL